MISMRTVLKNNIGLVFLSLWWMCCSDVVVANHAGIGVRGESLGGAYRAVASGNDIIYYNPAGLLRNRHIGADADYLMATESRLHALSVSVVDSQTTSWGIGIGYNAGITAKSETSTTHLGYLALAMPLGTDQLSLGAGLYYRYDNTQQEFDYRHFFNMDLGLSLDLGAGFRFAVVADHLLRGKGAEKSLGISVASSFALGDILEAIPLTTSFDWTMADVRSDGDLNHVLGLGFQYFAWNIVPLRFGYKSEMKDQTHIFNLGTGIVTESFAIDALYQQNLTIGKFRQFGIALRVTI